MQRVNQVRPQLGFHDDHQLGIHLVEEAVHGAGQIVGQIDVMYVFAESGLDAF